MSLLVLDGMTRLGEIKGAEGSREEKSSDGSSVTGDCKIERSCEEVSEAETGIDGGKVGGRSKEEEEEDAFALELLNTYSTH